MGEIKREREGERGIERKERKGERERDGKSANNEAVKLERAKWISYVQVPGSYAEIKTPNILVNKENAHFVQDFSHNPTS